MRSPDEDFRQDVGPRRRPRAPGPSGMGERRWWLSRGERPTALRLETGVARPGAAAQVVRHGAPRAWDGGAPGPRSSGPGPPLGGDAVVVALATGRWPRRRPGAPRALVGAWGAEGVRGLALRACLTRGGGEGG